MHRGRLITIEGLDGAGKTTLAAGLAESLRERGVEVELMREPGGVEASERVRSLVKDPSLDVGARMEALLYAAARPAGRRACGRCSTRRTWVLLDRFVDSSLAYQGVGRGIGVDAVRAINDFATGGLAPDRTLLLRVEPGVGRSRLSSRGEAPDRLEAEDDSFFLAIADAYDKLAAEEPERWRVIDASAPADAVLADALSAVADLTPS